MAKKDLLVKSLDSILDHARPRSGGESSPGEFRTLDIEALAERLGMTQALATPIEKLDDKQRSRCETLVLLASLGAEGKPYAEIVKAVERVKKGLAQADAIRAQQQEYDEAI
ncbi:MAG TPA: hypothetical protein VMU11_01810 [Verrucomicrobiae bacterium]|nr:hypothetical protein [Verrucomicrobiae bacterium]